MHVAYYLIRYHALYGLLQTFARISSSQVSQFYILTPVNRITFKSANMILCMHSVGCTHHYST